MKGAAIPCCSECHLPIGACACGPLRLHQRLRAALTPDGPASPPGDLREFCEQRIGEIDEERRGPGTVRRHDEATAEIHAYQEVLRKLESDGPASPVLGDEERSTSRPPYLFGCASGKHLNDGRCDCKEER